MNPSGPDSFHSWIIAIACCFINMMTYGMARLTGVLLVASSSRFQVSREKAAFPYTFAHVVRNSSGPLVGYLGQRFGVMYVTAFGCLVGAAGVGACYFAKNIETVIVLWGVVFGLGFGLGCILLQVSINQYFDKHRATASGISFSGVCLGSFFLPPIMEILLNTYELSGTFLLLSGFILNCVPVALLLKKPQFSITAHKNSHNVKNVKRQSSVSVMNVDQFIVEKVPRKTINALNGETYKDVKQVVGDGVLQHSTPTYEEKMRSLSIRRLSSENNIHVSTIEPLNVEKLNENSKSYCQIDLPVLQTDVLNLSPQFTDPYLNSERQYDDNSFSVQKQNSTDPSLCYQNSLHQGMDHSDTKVGTNYYVSEMDVEKKTYSQSVYEKDSSFHACQTNADKIKYILGKIKVPNIRNNSKSFDCSTADNFKVPPPEKIDKFSENCASNKKNNSSSPLGSFIVIFDPMFNLISITRSIYVLTVVFIFTIIVDFARDLNIGESNEKYVLMAVSIADFTGRLSLGWVTDGGYMTTAGFTSVLFACQGLAIAAIAWSYEFISLIIMATLYGLAGGALIGLFPILIAQYIEHDKQTVAISSSHFLSGPVCLVIPPLIGFFRDHLGAYDYLFYLISMLSFLCCFGFMLTPCISRCRKHS